MTLARKKKQSSIACVYEWEATDLCEALQVVECLMQGKSCRLSQMGRLIERCVCYHAEDRAPLGVPQG